ncbi:MAG: hypothetical protein KUL82_08930 [Bdellovibrio sp.]|nr:hypothetical protein [Bdellovibrio sp.]
MAYPHLCSFRWQQIISMEIGKQMQTETTEEQHNNDTEVVIPLHVVNEFTTREAVGDLGLPLIKHYAQKFSPEFIHPLIGGLSVEQWDDVLTHLWSPACLAVSEFWEQIGMASFLYQNGVIDFLSKRGHRYDPLDSHSTFLVRMIEEQADAVQIFLNQQLQVHAQEINGKTIHVFEMPPPQVAANFGNIVQAHLRANLVGKFYDSGYGSYCTVMKVASERATGFMVDHGLKIQSETRIGRDEKPLMREDRKSKTDTILYIPDSQLLWVSCNKQDAQMYADVVASILSGQPRSLRRKEFKLDQFLDKNLKTVLARVATEMNIEGIDLRAFVFINPRGGLQTLPTRRIGCIADFLMAEPDVSPTSRMKEIAFKLRLGADSKDYGTVVLKPGSMKIGKNLDPAIVSQFLAATGVWQLRADA